jgi:protein involved in polysaccharide export with SLBB domain
MGYPVPVREDGTITIPTLGRMSVRGMSVMQIEEMFRRKLVETQQRQPDAVNVMVTLQKRRTYQVMVIRQESISPMSVAASGMGSINLGEVKRGTGQIVNLQAYRNDVAHALAQTGGLPGLDAENAIYILRGVAGGPALRRSELSNRYGHTKSSRINPGSSRNNTVIRAQSQDEYRRGLPTNTNRLPLNGVNPHGFSPTANDRYFPDRQPPYGSLLSPERFSSENIPDQSPSASPPDLDWDRLRNPPATADELIDHYAGETEVTRIPIRLFPGEEVEFGPEDVLLRDGDIVFIESRETEIFYTGGLLGGGQYTLPRDYDLDVLGAVSIANGRQQSNSSGGGFGNRIGGISAMNQDISVGASTVVVLRQLPDGGQIPIKVNLYKAMRDPEERILIQPGDFIILQYTPIEAVGAFIERNLLAGSLIGIATQQNRSSGN